MSKYIEIVDKSNRSVSFIINGINYIIRDEDCDLYSKVLTAKGPDYDDPIGVHKTYMSISPFEAINEDDIIRFIMLNSQLWQEEQE